jgi:hypothetical protein
MERESFEKTIQHELVVNNFIYILIIMYIDMYLVLQLFILYIFYHIYNCRSTPMTIVELS